MMRFGVGLVSRRSQESNSAGLPSLLGLYLECGCRSALQEAQGTSSEGLGKESSLSTSGPESSLSQECLSDESSGAETSSFTDLGEASSPSSIMVRKLSERASPYEGSSQSAVELAAPSGLKSCVDLYQVREPDGRGLQDNTHSRSMNQVFTFRGVSLAAPAGFKVQEESQYQALLVGPYNNEAFAKLEKDFASAGLPVVLEYWARTLRIRMPSGLPSEKNVVEEGRLLWQQRNPNVRSDMVEFGSSGTFLMQGSIRSAGELRRFVPDSSLSRFTKYLAEVSKDYPNRILANGFFPETVVEVRSPGNPREELEEKAASLLALGTKEVFVIDGMRGLVKSFRLLAPGETEAEAKEEEGLERAVSVEPLSELLPPEDVPVGIDISDCRVVTMTDQNPSLLKSRVWAHLQFDVTPLKRDPLFWLPSVYFFKTDAEGLVQPFPFQRRTPGAHYDLPKQWESTPVPKYDWDAIAWTEERHNKLLMIDRALAAVEANDMAALELALVHIGDVNKRTSTGRLIMVDMIKREYSDLALRLLDEGVDWLAEDHTGTCAREAVFVWARTNARLVAAVENVPGDRARDLTAAVRLASLEWFEQLLQDGAEPDLVLAAAVTAPTATYLEAALGHGVSKAKATKFILQWAGPVFRAKEEKRRVEGFLEAVLSAGGGDAAIDSETEADVMDWAINAASPRIAEFLLDRGVDPNVRFVEPESAIEFAVGNTYDPEDAKKLVQALLQRGAQYDEEEVRRITQRKRRIDWLELES